jgi:hypothetical protein
MDSLKIMKSKVLHNHVTRAESTVVLLERRMETTNEGNGQIGPRND